MTQFICKECGYKLEAESRLKKCPYCDKDSLKKEESAEELIKRLN